MSVRRASAPILVGVALCLCATGAGTDGRAAKRAAAQVNGPADDVIREVMMSLDASSVEVVPLDRYALFGLDALADQEPCLGRKKVDAQLVMTCDGESIAATWPPARAADVAALLSDALRLVDPQREIRVPRRERVARALARAVDDPWTAYLPPALVAQVQNQQPALFSATPGIELWPRDPRKIRDVRRGSDAANEDIEPGMRITCIEGDTTEGLTLPEMVTRLSGANGSNVKLCLKAGKAERTVRVTRSLVPELDVTREDLGDGVVYVRIPVFKAGIAKRAAQLIWDARPRGVILDVRHNGGGLVREGIGLADLFLMGGNIAGVRGRPGRPQEDFVAKKDDLEIGDPLVVLVDGSSASASELFATVIKERHRGVILGLPTAGKSTVQRQIHLPDGGILKVTAGYYTGPLGQRISETGVQPNRYLAAPQDKTVLEGAPAARDPWVAAARDVLRRGDAGADRTPPYGAGPPP